MWGGYTICGSCCRTPRTIYAVATGPWWRHECSLVQLASWLINIRILLWSIWMNLHVCWVELQTFLLQASPTGHFYLIFLKSRAVPAWGALVLSESCHKLMQLEDCKLIFDMHLISVNAWCVWSQDQREYSPEEEGCSYVLRLLL